MPIRLSLIIHTDRFGTLSSRKVTFFLPSLWGKEMGWVGWRKGRNKKVWKQKHRKELKSHNIYCLSRRRADLLPELLFNMNACSEMSPVLAIMPTDITRPWKKHLASCSTINKLCFLFLKHVTGIVTVLTGNRRHIQKGLTSIGMGGAKGNFSNGEAPRDQQQWALLHPEAWRARREDGVTGTSALEKEATQWELWPQRGS